MVKCENGYVLLIVHRSQCGHGTGLFFQCNIVSVSCTSSLSSLSTFGRFRASTCILRADESNPDEIGVARIILNDVHFLMNCQFIVGCNFCNTTLVHEDYELLSAASF